MSRLPTWALAVIVGSIVAVVLAVPVLAGRDNPWRASLPFGNSDFFWVILIAVPLRSSTIPPIPATACSSAIRGVDAMGELMLLPSFAGVSA